MKVGTLLIDKSGIGHKVTKIFEGTNYIDTIEILDPFKEIPDYFPVHLSVDRRDFEIFNGNTLSDQAQLDCPCCKGTGYCEDIDNEKGSCLTCNGRGTM